MMKADEIALLDRTIKRLTPQSYLGPWLAEYRSQLVAAIEQDLPPDAPMPTEARAEARRILTAAQQEADETKRKSEEWAKGYKDQTRAMVHERIMDASRELERLGRTRYPA